MDKKGQSVRGLTRDDFVVTENDVPQTLTSFEAVVVPEVPRPSDAAPRRTVVSTNVVPDNRRGRTFAVVFDDIHLSPMQAQRARGAVGGLPPERGRGRRPGDPRRHRGRGLVDRPDAGGA